MMCEQMGVEPDPKRMMLKFSDLPLIVQAGMRVYSKLPDIYISLGMEGSSFAGKDYTGFLSICEVYGVRYERDKNTVLQVCEYIESKYVAKAHARLEKDNK
ncbi:tail assembly chaperone [Vibrio phage D260]